MPSPTIIALSVLAAIIPTAVYVALIYWVDRYEKDPWWLLASAFLWGAIPSILIAFVFNSVLSIPVYLVAGELTADVLSASLIAPPVEESVKGLVLLAIFWHWRHEIDSPLDGIIYGAMVGMGFAMVENVYYFVGVFAEGGFQAWSANVLMRGIVFGLNHALFSSMTGLGIALARMSTRSSLRYSAPVAGWMMAMFLHFVHNLSVSFNNALCLVALVSGWGGVWITLTIILWALYQERQWLRTYLDDEIGQGTLTRRQYETAVSGRRRLQHHLKLLSKAGPGGYWRSLQFFHHCSELAYKKHHFQLFEDEKSRLFIERLRMEIRSASPYLTAVMSGSQRRRSS